VPSSSVAARYQSPLRARYQRQRIDQADAVVTKAAGRVESSHSGKQLHHGDAGNINPWASRCDQGPYRIR
jgi:hypothetical protein